MNVRYREAPIMLPYKGSNTLDILDEVAEERGNQDRKWGQQNHLADRWANILMEEVGEASHARNELHGENYRTELVQVAAVAVAMIEAYDRGYFLG